MLVVLLPAGCDKITAMKKVVVRIATATGQWIEKEAKTGYEATVAVWKEIWGKDTAKGGSIEIDPWDPLKGRYVRDLEIRYRNVDADGKKAEMDLVLRRPTMHRPDRTSQDWNLDKSNFPASFSSE
jgi:hypothetical protein